jgi:1,4-alpha-glucan branching enzyme
VPVTFRFAGEPGQRVEVVGDLPRWDRPQVLTEVAPGRYERTLDLAPGLYRYKFLVQWRHWRSDPTAPVDRSEGVENSIVVVGGTRAPLHFAPDPRHLRREMDGALRLSFEVDVGARAPARIWVNTGDALVWAVVEPKGRWRERELFTATCPLPKRATGTWGFEGVPEHVFALPEPAPATARSPAWASSAVWYGIFLDRWHRGSPTSDPRVSPRTTPTSATTFYGGDLEGVRAHLGKLKALGVDGVVLTPLQPSQTPHRYDTTDHHAIDERLGGERALKALLV